MWDEVVRRTLSAFIEVNGLDPVVKRHVESGSRLMVN
jgi:hypothetical protein